MNSSDRVARSLVSAIVMTFITIFLANELRALGGSSLSKIALVQDIIIILGSVLLIRSSIKLILSLVILFLIAFIVKADSAVSWLVAAVVIAVIGRLFITLQSISFENRKYTGILFLIIKICFALLVSSLIVALSAIEEKFADDEFVYILEIVIVGVLVFLSLHINSLGLFKASSFRNIRFFTGFGSARILSTIAILWLLLSIFTITCYQKSFYPTGVPYYRSIDIGSPFLCSYVRTSEAGYSSAEVQRSLIGLVEKNPRKEVPEYGMLALATGEERWAGLFRRSVLSEVGARRFVSGSSSVKSWQYDAALRAYYVGTVQKSFPHVFDQKEWDEIRLWFSDINRRAFRIEWVDLFYSLAFRNWPSGIYASQDDGLGLLSILEKQGLGDIALTEQNRKTLAERSHGWNDGFRNTDDCYRYQEKWIVNALFQSAFQDGDTRFYSNRSRSFQWMLIQSLPNGDCITYNFPSCSLSVGVAYLGSKLENDPELAWWSGRMVEWAAAQDVAVRAVPGMESPHQLRGISPRVGSCLLYGDSGLPGQSGPLAPDKIVFRDGWQSDASYLLLNLRFSGWHRYKGTNAIVMIYKNRPVVTEYMQYLSHSWLPAGRRLFRDKRIPRENLNGILVPRTRFSNLIHIISGIGSEWAQDPPYYADVESVEWLGELDYSRTSIRNWRGWSHARRIYFVHQGPIIVVDSASGRGRGALVWHVAGVERRDETGVWLGKGPERIRMIMPKQNWKQVEVEYEGIIERENDIVNLWRLLYREEKPNSLEVTTIFLNDEWSDSTAVLKDVHGGKLLELSDRERRLNLLENRSGAFIDGKLMMTDSEWAMLINEREKWRVCQVGGTAVKVVADSRPRFLQNADGHAFTNWQWEAGWLTLLYDKGAGNGCVIWTESDEE